MCGTGGKGFEAGIKLGILRSDHLGSVYLRRHHLVETIEHKVPHSVHSSLKSDKLRGKSVKSDFKLL